MPRQKKRVRLKADDRRDRIISTAIQLFASRGFFDTSFQRIADECGVSQSAVLYHFKNRDELFESVLQHLVRHNHEIVSQLMRPEDSADERLRKHFWGNLLWALENPSEGQTLLLLYYLASYHARFSVIYAQMVKTARARVAEYVLAGIREGIFRADLEVDSTAEMLHEGLLGGFINHLTLLRSGEVPPDPRPKWEKLLKSFALSAS